MARAASLDLLGGLRMQVKAVQCGVAAIAEMEAAQRRGRPYDVLLMEWRMPQLNRLDALRRLQGGAAISGTLAAMMVDASDPAELLAQAGDVRLDGVLHKPLSAAAAMMTMISNEPGPLRQYFSRQLLNILISLTVRLFYRIEERKLMKKKNSLLIYSALIGFHTAGVTNFGFATTLAPTVLSAEKTFRFEQYPAKIVEPKRSVRPILSTKLARRYKTDITYAVREPVDFAGHYRVARWGCGTDCHGFAIINKLTGLTYTLPGVAYVAGVNFNDDDRLQYKPDSRLFIMAGLQNDEVEGKFYYLWENERLRLLGRAPLKKELSTDF